MSSTLIGSLLTVKILYPVVCPEMETESHVTPDVIIFTDWESLIQTSDKV